MAKHPAIAKKRTQMDMIRSIVLAAETFILGASQG